MQNLVNLAIPAMDWVYGIGFSSMDEPAQLSIRASHFLNTVSEQEDWQADWRCRAIFAEEANEILMNPLCGGVLNSDAMSRIDEIARIATQSS